MRYLQTLIASMLLIHTTEYRGYGRLPIHNEVVVPIHDTSDATGITDCVTAAPAIITETMGRYDKVTYHCVSADGRKISGAMYIETQALTKYMDEK